MKRKYPWINSDINTIIMGKKYMSQPVRCISVILMMCVAAGLHSPVVGIAGDYYRQVLMFGTDREIAEAFSKVGEDLGDDINTLVLAAFDEDHHVRVYSSLVRYIGETGLQEGRAVLIAELDRPGTDDDYLETVIGALGKLKHKDAVDPLMTYYGGKRITTRLKKAVISALGEIGDRRVEDRLIAVVEDKREDVSVRAAAILSLGMIDSKKSFRMLEGIALNRYEKELLRMYAAHSIATIGGEDALDTLDLLVEDESHRVAEYAVTALATIDSPRTGEILMKALRSDFDAVRYHAVRGIAELRYVEATDILRYKAQYDANERVRKEAQETLRKFEAMSGESQQGASTEGNGGDAEDI
jgi:HEAT repeat protein